MPLFFLLSGFSLMVSYGQKLGVSVEFDEESDSAELVRNIREKNCGKSYSKTVSFHRNRFARVFPVYYTALLFALPYWFLGYGDASQTDRVAIIVSVINSVLPLCTVFIFLLGSPIDGPGWTVCTLSIMWLMFPCLVPGIRRQSDSELVRSILVCYWAQLLIIVLLFPALLPLLGFWPAFAASTMNPLSRLPVFLMGAYAGELCVRSKDGEPLPWPPSLCLILPYGTPRPSDTDAHRSTTDSAYWTGRATRQSLLLLTATIAVSMLDAAVRLGLGGGSVLGCVWLQALVPFAQLEVLVGLTRAHTSAPITLTLRSPLALWLGERSLCLYLVHFPVIRYLCWAVHGGSLEWPGDGDCSADTYGDSAAQHSACQAAIDAYNDARAIPMWGIPVVVLVSVLMAALLHRYVELPCRHWLRTMN